MKPEQLSLTALLEEKAPAEEVSAPAVESATPVESENNAKPRGSAVEESVEKPSEEKAEPADALEPHVYSVSELNAEIRDIVEGEFPLIWIKAELSNFVAHRTGHFYFSLKDKNSQVRSVMFRRFNAGLKFKPESGMEVLIRGRITVYEPRGDYQVFCEHMEPVGLGALQAEFEQLKKKLEKEGLFEVSRKKQLPALPEKIAVVTSPTGAAIRDIVNVLNRRFKGLEVVIVPASVQGEQAAGQIVAGIELANRVGGFDAMIVGRGGGSIEDLWCFNDEKVARAITASKIPIISAVGHEIDFTIADFVADLRAPTPSAAAELVVKNTTDLLERIKTAFRQMRTHMGRKLQMDKQAVEGLSKRLLDPQRRLQDYQQRCDELLSRLEMAFENYAQERKLRVEVLRERLKSPQEVLGSGRQKLELLDVRLKSSVQKSIEKKIMHLGKLGSILESLSPLGVLDRGYSITSLGKKVIKSSTELKKGDLIKIRLFKGSVKAKVEELENEGGKKR